MIMLMLGGISIPSVPPAQMLPKASRSLYLRSSSAGRAMVPIVAEVAILDPEVAANMAEAMMLVCSSPPGTRDNQPARALYMRSLKPARSSSSPSRMNRGIDTSR
jgi:hypothetical protein